MTNALILTGAGSIDSLDTFDFEMIPASSLREGMLLVDPDLGTPVYALDQRIRAAKGAGQVTWMVEDFENGGWHQASFGTSAMVPVATR